ncbi:MAG: hypothetical protein BWZ10_01115 [candidate division BRC1 bacterium ADurb.BinA364]|nr:MAG: hypothetical protein BWZ10_01115 [candidate division BRC1 bacterium ADurb.BinA364]
MLVLFALSSKDVSIRFVNFYAVAQTGLRLDRTLESFQDKPNASVFVQDALSNTARILPHNARQAGGAVFMLAPDEARLARYRREHPDRDVYLVRPIDGGWESVPLGNPGQ